MYGRGGMERPLKVTSKTENSREVIWQTHKLADSDKLNIMQKKGKI